MANRSPFTDEQQQMLADMTDEQRYYLFDILLDHYMGSGGGLANTPRDPRVASALRMARRLEKSSHQLAEFIDEWRRGLQVNRPTPRRRQGKLPNCWKAANDLYEWATKAKPTLLDGTLPQIHAWLTKAKASGNKALLNARIPPNPTTFSQYVTNYRTASDLPMHGARGGR